jgi:type II secretory pathway component PulF
MRVPMNPWSEAFLRFVGWATQYFTWLPIVLAVGIFLWWYAAGRAVSAQPIATARWFRWLPGMRGMLRTSAAATFCEILALLVEHGEPLPSALALAGTTSGNPRLATAANLLGERLARGENIAPSDRQLRHIPALVCWMIAGSQQGGQLVAAIRAAGENYRERTLLAAEWMSIYVPMLLVVAIGGAAVLLFTFGVLGPWSTLLYGIGDSIGRGIQ